jgi:hypothetical protein
MLGQMNEQIGLFAQEDITCQKTFLNPTTSQQKYSSIKKWAKGLVEWLKWQVTCLASMRP